jgi:CRISPR/Cas system-associated endonuclease Cas1
MVRVKQFEICQNQKGLALAKQLIIGKLKNQSNIIV